LVLAEKGVKQQMQFVDTHCHLDAVEFDQDREEVIRRATDQQIAAISSAISARTYEKNLEICRTHQGIYAALGLDPLEYANADNALKWIRTYTSEIVAIGETGLDYYLEREHGSRHEQEVAFTRMIDIAKELGLPIQVHSRSAGYAALIVLEKNDAQNVHMHAFDGKAKLAGKATQDLGYYFSIPTSVIHSPQKRKLAKAVEIDHLLLETDSPVLGPERDKRNEPANLLIALKETALILGREEEELRKIILENTLRLYTKIRN
jgi:TatD DNase family protein